MDTFTVILIAIATGERFILQNVIAEVEIKQENYNHITIGGMVDHQMVIRSHLDIVLEMHNLDRGKFKQLKNMIFNEELLLSFQDVHPNLIKGRVTGTTMDMHKISIEFRGNSIDKTFNEYIIEMDNQLKLTANQHIWESSKLSQSKPKKFKNELKPLKRRLTF